MSAPRVTFTASPVVWVVIKGEERDEYETRDDGGLIGRFMAWMLKERVFQSRAGGGTVGGGVFMGAFAPADAERVIDWLRAEGVDHV